MPRSSRYMSPRQPVCAEVVVCCCNCNVFVESLERAVCPQFATITIHGELSETPKLHMRRRFLNLLDASMYVYYIYRDSTGSTTQNVDVEQTEIGQLSCRTPYALLAAGQSD